VSGEGARLLQQAVDQRGFAMIDVRDDGDIADRTSGRHVKNRAKKAAQRNRAPPRLRPRRAL